MRSFLLWVTAGTMMLLGCERHLVETSANDASFARVRAGMTRAQVIELMGTPSQEHPKVHAEARGETCRKAQVVSEVVYYRHPPRQSFFIYFDSSDHVSCAETLGYLVAQ